MGERVGCHTLEFKAMSSKPTEGTMVTGSRHVLDDALEERQAGSTGHEAAVCYLGCCGSATAIPYSTARLLTKSGVDAATHCGVPAQEVEQTAQRCCLL